MEGSAAMSPNLLYSTEEQDLRASVRDLLTDRCPPERVLERCEEGETGDPALWHTLATQLGATSLHVPDELGGQGASVREVAVVAEELGRFVAPVPFLGSAVLATSALLGCRAGQQRDAVLADVAAGNRTATLVVPLSSCVGGSFPTAVRAGEGRLSGSVRTVADGASADCLIVPARGADGPELYVVDAAEGRVAVDAVTSFDITRPVSDVEFDDVAGVRIADPDLAATVLDDAVRTGAGVLASEQVGVAEWCLDSTVEYLKQRYQFGRALASYQALKHRLADLWYELVVARAAARYAADQLATASDDAPVAVGVAQSLCARVARHAAEECVQLHGGIGMTWEHPAHLYLKRAKADEIALGSPSAHHGVLGPLVDLHPAP
ncbi:acyl-CoA dehydrogenase family protein [Haloechinothrix aidingensis]|nr:acyl-CoA dehydrogenase family protein [Haloechinothrix aidingensis]